MRYIYKKKFGKTKICPYNTPTSKKIKKIVRFYEIVVVGDQVYYRLGS
jgi:hypothetical protein